MSASARASAAANRSRRAPLEAHPCTNITRGNAPRTARAAATVNPAQLAAQRASTEASCYGWVYKQSDWLASWRRRWLVLWTRPAVAGGGCFLLSYSSATDAKPRTVVELSPADCGLRVGKLEPMPNALPSGGHLPSADTAAGDQDHSWQFWLEVPQRKSTGLLPARGGGIRLAHRSKSQLELWATELRQAGCNNSQRGGHGSAAAQTPLDRPAQHTEEHQNCRVKRAPLDFGFGEATACTPTSGLRCPAHVVLLPAHCFSKA